MQERNQIDEKYKWDLTKIYEDDEVWYKNLEEVKKEINKVKEFKDLLTSSKKLLEYLKYDANISIKIEKLYTYASLNHDSDTTNTKYQTMYKQILDVYSKYGEYSSYINPLFMKTDYKIIEKYMKENKELKEYEFNIKNLYRYQKHSLNENEEKILSILTDALEISEETYKALTDSDMRFNKIKVDNEEIELTDSNYSIYIKSFDRNVRKQAFEEMYKTYSKYKNTITSTYTGDINTNIDIAKIRKYNSVLESSLYNDNIDKNIYENLVNTVNNKLDVLYKYYDLKKQKLKLDELHLYDVYVPIVKENDKKYTFKQAKELVLGALSILGDTYIKDLKQAFDQRWIDVYNNKGKRSGAYSGGSYDTNPYVLLNYTDTLNDVSTLAHELGHSMHTYYSHKNNPYQCSNYKIFVAEVASTVNELLLSKYMFENSKSKEEKLSILNERLELFKGTIFRQTMFAEFEKEVYERREKGEILTNDVISDYYYSLVKKYFGPRVVCDDLIKYEWERIPHFYYGFYVYKYATGISAACFIVDQIENNNGLSNYLEFLKTGGRDYPTNELKIAGVDMNDPKVIESAIDMFEDTLNKFKELS